VGMELMVAAQAVDLRKAAKLGAGAKRAYQWVRGLSAMLDEDRSLGAEVEAVGAGILDGDLTAAL
jgi:histidine ammonia-lyase